MQKLLKALPYLAIFLITTIGLIVIFHENPVKALLIELLLIAWLVIGWRSRSFIFSGLLILIFVWPFNVTFELPYSIHLFGKIISLANPFVDGIRVNYLIPALSIIDLGFFLILTASLFENFNLLKKTATNLLLLALLAYFTIHNLLFTQFSVLFNTSRVILYVAGILLIINWFKEVFRSNKDKKGFLQFVSKKTVLVSMLIVCVFNVLIQGIVAYWQFIKGTSLGLTVIGESKLVVGQMGVSFANLGGGLKLRGYGTFPHPNVLGGYLLFQFLIGIFFWTMPWVYSFKFIKTNSARKYIQTLGIIITLLSSGILFLTFSRIVILAWGIVVIFLAVYFLSKRFLSKKNMVIPGFFLMIKDRFSILFSSGDVSLTDRLKLMNNAYKLIRTHPIAGVGWGNFVSGMGNDMPYTTGGFSLAQPVHNIPLLLIAENGLIGGLFLILVSIGTMFWALIKSKGAFKVFVICCIICIIFPMMFDHYLITLPQGLFMFASSLGLLSLWYD